MTMLSFRVDDDDADLVVKWTQRLAVGKSSLLRTALRKHLRDLASEEDAASWKAQPLTAEESALEEVADWGPAEDWSDWA